MEELAIMWFGEVDLSLASLDVFKPDFVIQVNATDGGRRYFFHQIPCETSAPSPPVIDARITPTWTEKPTTQYAAM